MIFADSLAHQRPDISEAESTHYEEVYGYRLKKHIRSDDEGFICLAEDKEIISLRGDDSVNEFSELKHITSVG